MSAIRMSYYDSGTGEYTEMDLEDQELYKNLESVLTCVKT